MLAPMGTLVVWTLLDVVRTGRVTAVGGATAIVVGLVAITPAAGYISPMSSIFLGSLAAFPSYFAIIFRSRTRLDDSLDVVAAHGVGGTVGALLTGVFADKVWSGAGNGLIGGNAGQIGIQALGIAAALFYSMAMTFILLKLIGLVVPLRATARDEALGLDVTDHGEEAYAEGDGAILVGPELMQSLVASPAVSTEGGRA
jgi:Amt family ammonium transporter